MIPREYEEFVAEVLRGEGWEVEITPETGDYGVDLFARRRDESLAVQTKMYGGSSRSVNRAAVMELFGAAAYFACTGSLIVTDGSIHV